MYIASNKLKCDTLKSLEHEMTQGTSVPRLSGRNASVAVYGGALYRNLTVRHLSTELIHIICSRMFINKVLITLIFN
jgi:hypothetical protein